MDADGKADPYLKVTLGNTEIDTRKEHAVPRVGDEGQNTVFPRWRRSLSLCVVLPSCYLPHIGPTNPRHSTYSLCTIVSNYCRQCRPSPRWMSKSPLLTLGSTLEVLDVSHNRVAAGGAGLNHFLALSKLQRITNLSLSGNPACETNEEDYRAMTKGLCLMPYRRQTLSHEPLVKVQNVVVITRESLLTLSSICLVCADVRNWMASLRMKEGLARSTPAATHLSQTSMARSVGVEEADTLVVGSRAVAGEGEESMALGGVCAPTGTR